MNISDLPVEGATMIITAPNDECSQQKDMNYGTRSSLDLNELRRQLLMDRNASLQALAEGPQRTARERKVRRGATFARAKYKYSLLSPPTYRY